MKKLLAIVLTLALCMGLVVLPASAEEVAKPEKITIFVDGTVFTESNAQDKFIERWEELSGIELEIIQPDHDAYYDVLQQQIASGEWPDVMILSSTYYAAYASEGVLWDMTDAWENSATKNSGRFTGDDVIEGLKIGGRLYGFADARGGGCVTYVKKAWLDAVGMEAPTTWDEYAAMCDAFVNQDPDGDGAKDTYALTAAGFIGVEAPFVNYLPEFYQDAYPSFYQNEEGVWVDGFTEPAMEAALARLAEGYSKGWIDPTTLTNGTNDCRNKFYDDTTGIFTYWSGTWATNLKNNLVNNGHDGELIALAPLEGAPGYFDRTPPVWAISSTCERNFLQDPGLHRTLLGDGMATSLAALFVAPANTTYGENTGVLALSRVYDPRVIRIAAGLAILLSFSPKFAALVSAMPTATMGGVSMVLYGMISAVGVRNIVENQVDFTNSRNVIIAAIIMVLAIGVNYSGAVTFSVGSIEVSLSGLAVAAIAGIALNAVLPGKDYEFGEDEKGDTSVNFQV